MPHSPSGPPRPPTTTPIWRILEPTFRAGETYPIPRDVSRTDALAYWRSAGHAVFVAEQGGDIVGTYYLRANTQGGGAHVANCGYMVARGRDGTRRGAGDVRTFVRQARQRGFAAMQFNFVIASNERAVRLWQPAASRFAARCPAHFAHPKHGLVDAM